jgi:isopenicillin-N N-acyltransferase-like protein
MEKTADMPVIVLEGSARERGRIHGEALKPTIRDFVGIWKSQLHKATGMHPDRYLDRFLAETELLAAVERWTPDLLEEVNGIAEGSGIELNTILALQLVDEEWWYRREQASLVSDPGGEHCSALGVFDRRDLAPVVAQNLDVNAFYDGYQAVLHIKEPASPIEAFVFTTAGFIAMNGVNNKGIGICCNALLQLNHARDGLPVAFVHRGVLAQSTLDDAIAFIHRVKHASGQNYIIGSPEAVVSYECSANQVSEYAPFEGATRLYHTNHPLANDDLVAKTEAFEGLSPDEDLIVSTPTNSEARLESLACRLKDEAEAVTVETVKSILGAHDSDEHPVCRHKKPDGGGMTLGCQIMVLSTPPVLHVSPGPACSTEFRTFTF